MDRIKDILSNPKTSLALCLLGGVLIIGGLVTNGFAKPKLPTTLKAADFPAKSIDSSVSEFKVDVSGAVANPGVYSLPNDSRVEDAIKAAGGFSLDANGEFVAKSLNLSAKLIDGSKIYIPKKGETGGVLSATVGLSNQSSANSVNSLVGINSGTESELDSLPGVGPVTAKKIVSSRPYTSLDELVSKKVVSASVFAKIQGQIDLH
ncbi:hypothetical protein A2631_01040 [Candidatus Daviesbacteria bacterium RIFCSPHIGHO2_01_FULL_44_29]|uniref:Soluble ligand binding domain-containing protein n=1 Tax=Candidatus Daviesbacteria bacterium RIFCSPHIGHO2_02_FULL_43_12 TaxID=1797776 RepID=A0A1F5KIM6_9BACT|nr:MAG: hypothetical protein A2631_01040 [Candidatus Daviesbacteria bacterium RIFCSPHIGHO2_01_FULL_44_29]OGE40429.1 MAG: hypothetical protein A3E86_03245 [Candidatus Daviesbacteria bacterium RIFCSPHIGHO2_12_FULL_47_45]OGE40738.1 MAG: hypothetical protein A3D25_05705 [Candidatus Daviesbacteria bacterium RIFCSPHIGHO2_02_FULL_43_12]OGE69764.1 MAG: hypothetical protein A3B55_05105 [Candidatus Daviesbacteria bacterium RIFCSPLOWO2_01_FULL_43_15]